MDRPAIPLVAALLALQLAAAAPGAAACSSEAEALAALAALRDESARIYEETAAVERNLEEALARRAKEAGWDDARRESFRAELLADPEYLALYAQRENAASQAAETTARLVTSAASGTPMDVCADLPKARFANQRLRTVLGMEYEWLNRRIWGR